MNARLGNRSAEYKEFAPHTQDGRIQQCPLCRNVWFNEVHLLIECKMLDTFRKQLKIKQGITLYALFESYRRKDSSADLYTLARMFLGQERGLKKMDYVKRGIILEAIVEKFFNLWQIQSGIRRLTNTY